MIKAGVPQLGGFRKLRVNVHKSTTTKYSTESSFTLAINVHEVLPVVVLVARSGKWLHTYFYLAGTRSMIGMVTGYSPGKVGIGLSQQCWT